MSTNVVQKQVQLANVRIKLIIFIFVFLDKSTAHYKDKRALRPKKSKENYPMSFINKIKNNPAIKKTVNTVLAAIAPFLITALYRAVFFVNTPLGKTNINLRKEYHRRIAELYTQGMPQSVIAETLWLPINTVRSYIRRSRK